MNVPVTPHLRALLVAEFPRVFAHGEEHLVRLLHYLLFPTAVDKDSRLPLIHRKMLVKLHGEAAAKEARGNRYSGEKYLRSFREAVNDRLVVGFYNYTRKKARTAFLNLDGLDELAQAIEDNMCEPSLVKLVDLATGKRVTQVKIDEARRQVRVRRQEQSQEKSSPAAISAQWLNKHQSDSKTFSRVESNIDAALDVAKAIGEASKRRASLSILYSLRLLGVVPTYKTTAKTPRMYTTGTSAAGLPSAVREILFGGGRGTFHADLVAAQLAVLAHIWTMPLTTQILVSGQPVWEALLEVSGLGLDDKAALKTFIYSTAFGKAPHSLKWEGIQKFGKARTERLWNTPVIQELLDAREKRVVALQEEGGFTDVFGQYHDLQELAQKPRWNGKPTGTEKALKTLMAYEAQAYEFRLMQPILELVQNNSEYRILFWLHDGVYLNNTQPERNPVFLRRLSDMVDARATELGIHTRLDIEQI